MSIEPDDELLVVDDDEDVRAGFVGILQAAGYRVREAEDGQSCLQEVSRRRPSLILLDVSMPVMDGLETLRRLRAGPDADIPVVLLTGARLDAESIGSGLVLGAEEYLSKPVRPDELTARIRALLHLAAARRELEAVKRDQTAMLVHDLKQPLAIIALRAEFVADESSDPELIRSGQSIRDACRQMEQLINSVLELSRLEAGQLRLQRAPYPIASLLNEVVDQLRGLAERRGIQLTAHVVGELGTIAIDRTKVMQVLQNLLGNALKFTPSGGRIEVQAAHAGDEVQIAVEDTGCGIPPDDAEQVFDKWHQTRAGRARGGSGLGLAIARAIIEAHGGRIGAGGRGDGERGARFWFVLPSRSQVSDSGSEPGVAEPAVAVH
jgi:two-component system sensor histidine kinase/response regulator